MELTILQWIGASTGIIGALLLALNCKHSAWAWVLWIVSGIAWIGFSLISNTYGLLIQHLVFTAINGIGVYNWLIKIPPSPTN